MDQLRQRLYDLDAGEFREHTPEFLSSTQLPVEWDPDAQCPYYLEWAADQIGDQLDDLEETVAVMLDPTVTPTRAVFLYGPSRSGKGTYLRLVERAAGSANVSAVSLQEMATDVFAGATVFGKIANIAGDLAATEVSDTSLYKKMTGDDIVHANRKYGQTWEFHNRALFLFGANEVPQVSEQSNAFLNRTKPFRFDVTFEGREDPAVEAALLPSFPASSCVGSELWNAGVPAGASTCRPTRRSPRSSPSSPTVFASGQQPSAPRSSPTSCGTGHQARTPQCVQGVGRPERPRPSRIREVLQAPRGRRLHEGQDNRPQHRVRPQGRAPPVRWRAKRWSRRPQSPTGPRRRYAGQTQFGPVRDGGNGGFLLLTPLTGAM